MKEIIKTIAEVIFATKSKDKQIAALQKLVRDTGLPDKILKEQYKILLYKNTLLKDKISNLDSKIHGLVFQIKSGDPFKERWEKKIDEQKSAAIEVEKNLRKSLEESNKTLKTFSESIKIKDQEIQILRELLNKQRE